MSTPLQGDAVERRGGEVARQAVVRLAVRGARLIANTPAARDDILQWMVSADPLDAAGEVSTFADGSVFTPDGF